MKSNRIHSIPISSVVGSGDLEHVIRTAVVSRVPRSAFCTYQERDRMPKLGDVALVEVVELGEDDRIEVGCPRWDDPESQGAIPFVQPVVSFATLSLTVGRRLICAFGGRYATDYLLAEVPDSPQEYLDLVTFGGVVGTVVSSNTRRGRVAKVRLVSFFADASGETLNTRSFKPRGISASPSNLGKVKLAVVTGGSMEAGKTTAGAAFTKVVAGWANRAWVGKVTGCGSFRDPHRLAAGGARGTSEFMAFGYPSTHGISAQEVRKLFWSLVNLLAEDARLSPGSAPWIVIEIADGLPQPQTRALLTDPSIRHATSALLYAAYDSMSARAGIQQLRDWGWEDAIVTGPVASSALGRQEVRELCDGQAITFFDSLDPAAEQDALGRKLLQEYL